VSRWGHHPKFTRVLRFLAIFDRVLVTLENRGITPNHPSEWQRDGNGSEPVYTAILRRHARRYFDASHCTRRFLMNSRASNIDIGSVRGSTGSTPCRASPSSAVTLFIVCRNRRIFVLVVHLFIGHWSLVGGHRKFDVHGEAHIGVGGRPNAPTVSLNDRAIDREAHPQPLRLAADEMLEDLLQF
jgi:hypothetical protein